MARPMNWTVTIAAGWISFLPAAWADETACVNVVGSEAISEKQTLDPAFLVGTDEAIHIWPLYEPLARVTDDFQLIPVLATSWERNADATQWTFHLRRGVKFHDGSGFDASDVVYTYRRLIDPDVGSPGAAELAFLSADAIEAVDEHTVRFTMAMPVTELPMSISTKFTTIVPEGKTGDWLAANAAGTGPFMVEKFARGAPVAIYRKNPNYWDPSLPKAECLRITAIDQPVSQVTALLAGESDYVPFLDAASAVTLKESPDVTILTSKGGFVYTLSMMVDRPPFDDNRVRRALKLVVDRQAMLDTVFLGFGEPANDNPIPPSFPGAYTNEAPKRDVAQAKGLLAEAGYPNGVEVDLFTADDLPALAQMAEVFAQMAAVAGITVRVQKMPGGIFWDEVWLKRPFVTNAWGIRPFGNALSIAYRSDAPWNETAWRRPDYDALLDKARVTVDDGERADVYKTLQRMLAEEGGVIAPVFAYALAAMRGSCSGFIPTPATTPDFSQLSCAD